MQAWFNSEQPQPQPVRASQGLIAPEAFSALGCSMMRGDLKLLSRFSDANSLQQSSSELPIEEIVPIEEIAWCKTLNCSCESCKDQQAPVQRFCAPRSLPFKTLINSVATKAPMSIGPRVSAILCERTITRLPMVGRRRLANQNANEYWTQKFQPFCAKERSPGSQGRT